MTLIRRYVEEIILVSWGVFSFLLIDVADGYLSLGLAVFGLGAIVGAILMEQHLREH